MKTISSSSAPPARRSAPSTARFASLPAHELGKVAIQAALERAGVEAAEVDEVILGQVLTAGAGPEPGPPGLDRRRHPGREPRLGPEPALRLGPARRGARQQQILDGDARSSSPAARRA